MRPVRTTPHCCDFYVGNRSPIWWDATQQTFLANSSTVGVGGRLLINTIPSDEIALQAQSDTTLVAGFRDVSNYFGLEVRLTRVGSNSPQADRWLNEFEAFSFPPDGFPPGLSEPPVPFPNLFFQEFFGTIVDTEAPTAQVIRATSEWYTVKLFQLKDGSRTDLATKELPYSNLLFHPRLSLVHDPNAPSRLMGCVTYVSRQNTMFEGYADSYFLDSEVLREDCGGFCGFSRP